MSLNPSDRREVRMNVLDRAIAVVSPKLALHRMNAKAQLVRFGYNDKSEQREAGSIAWEICW